jgi:hypothetical protein
MAAGQFFTRRPLAVAGSVAMLAAGITAVASLGADRSSKAGAQGGPGAFPSVAIVATGLTKNGSPASPRFETTVFGVSIQSEPDPGTDAAVEFGDDRPDPSSPDVNHTYKGHNAKVRVGDIGAVWGLAYAGGDPTAATADGRGPRSFYASYAKSTARVESTFAPARSRSRLQPFPTQFLPPAILPTRSAGSTRRVGLMASRRSAR